MAYDEQLADRIRQLLRGDIEVTEKRMFGGLAFLVNGHLAVTASGQGALMLRVEPSRTAASLSGSVRRMQMRGRELDGWLLVEGAAVQDDDALAQWVALGVDYARSLPPK